MMPGIGFAEMMMLVLVAIVVIGPKDLPLMMRKFGRFTGKMRALAFEFKQGIDELGRQAELEELRKEVADLKKHTGLEDFAREMEHDRANLEKDVASAMQPAAIPPPVTPAPAVGAAAAGVAGTAQPGYDAGEDFRIDGSLPPASVQPDTNVDVVDDPPAPAPTKQETPA